MEIERKTQTNDPQIPTPVVFPADAWEHACPIIRITGPAEFNNMKVLRGCEWEDGHSVIKPDLIQESDLVIIQRDFPARVNEYEMVMAEARRLSKTVIYEIDDLLPELPGRHSNVIRYHPTRLAILRALVEADAVTCSTPALRDYLRTYNVNTYVLPNYLNDRLWNLRSRTGIPSPNQSIINNHIVIGYLGSDSHMPDLASIESVLIKLLKRYGKQLELKLWGMVPTESLSPFSNVSWTQVGMVSYQQFAEYFQEQWCDIFIAPLLDNPFNRCKSPLKFLEYSSSGIPGVFSNLDGYKLVVDPGENGFLATSLSEWEEQLVNLIEDPELRQTIGSAAQEKVRQDWLLTGNAAKWVQVYNDAIKNNQSLQRSGASDADKKLDIANEFTKKAQSWQIDISDHLQEKEHEISRLINHIHKQSKELRKLSVDLSSREQAYLTVNALYQEIMTSTGWRVMQRLFRMRERLLPIGSRREAIVRLSIFSLQVIRREGITAFLKGVTRRVKAKISGDKSPSAASEFRLPETLDTKTGQLFPTHPLPIQVSEGTNLGLPAISLLVLCPNMELWTGEEMPKAAEVITWAEQQTIGLGAVEIIFWNMTDSIAWRVNQQSGAYEESWKTANFNKLIQNLYGRYLCIAYRDLLTQPETYLEENFIALETESLAFTVNLKGFPDWVEKRLDEGYLPGGNLLPFFRQIVTTSCVRLGAQVDTPSMDGLYLDVSDWLEDRQDIPNVIGKLIIHTTWDVDHYESLPLGTRFHDTNWKMAGTHIITNSNDIRVNGDINRIARLIHPVESVIPVEIIPSEKPTVILAMSFLAVGGAEQLALNIIDRLQDKLRFIVLSTDEMDPTQGNMAEAFREITPYVYTTPAFIDPKLRISFIFYLVNRFHPDAFYIANGASVLYDALDPLKRLYPEMRTMTQVFDYTEGWINRYDISLVTYLDAHIAPHAKICQAYVEKGARPDNVFQVPAVVYVSKFHPEAYSQIQKEEIRLRLKLPQNKKIVTFASRMNAQKRPMDFVLLAQKFINDPSIIFLMIGEGQEAEGVDLVISKIGINNIIRHNFYRPINDILAITDVLVLPSSFEGMPLIISETMAMGKPVVVTDVGNNREVVSVTGGGVVVSQIGDIHALADGVRQVLAHPPDPNSLRQAVYNHYSIEAGAEFYYRIFLGKTGPEESFEGSVA